MSVNSTFVRQCSSCQCVLGRVYERTGAINDMKLWCRPCYQQKFEAERLPITVDELISQLQALPEWSKELPVNCSYDGSCCTGVYGVREPSEGNEFGGGSVCLVGD